jgi:membrane-associated phospholipid phosphatase
MNVNRPVVGLNVQQWRDVRMGGSSGSASGIWSVLRNFVRRLVPAPANHRTESAYAGTSFSALHKRLAFLGYFLIPLIYFTALVVVYLRYGVLLQASLLGVFVAFIPLAAYLGRSSDFLRSSLLFTTVLLTYEALQGLTGVLVNAGSVASLTSIDKALVGVNVISIVQTAFDSPTTTLISTIFYGLHVFLVVIGMVLFWFTSRRVYKGYAYSMILTSYLALMTFIILPSAPPWFEGTGKNMLSDGYTMLPNAFKILQQTLVSMESDKFAAFPSLHAAYAALFTVYTIKLKPRLALISVPVLVGVLFSTVYLGQHYLVDLIAGIAYSLASVAVVERLFFRKGVSRRSESADN